MNSINGEDENSIGIEIIQDEDNEIKVEEYY